MSSRFAANLVCGLSNSLSSFWSLRLPRPISYQASADDYEIPKGWSGSDLDMWPDFRTPDRMTCPCVLVVDDEPDIRNLLAAILRQEGYKVLSATNGAEALEAMAKAEVNLVVLDLMMPIKNGFDVLEVRAADPKLQRIPVVVVTAHLESEAARALEKGICAVMPKPFNIADLRALVSDCLHNHTHA